MHSTTVAVDLAKNVFELAIADGEWKITERLRLNRKSFRAFFVHLAPARVVTGGVWQRASLGTLHCGARA